MRKALFLSVFALAGLVSFNAAAADELGEPGQLTLGAERVFGINHYSETTSPDGGDEQTDSGTSIGLIFNDSTTVYTVPRLALDYMVADGVSIGGSVGYINRTTKSEVGSQSDDGPTLSGFIFSPRVGYVIPVSDGLDFWVRGGITYYNISTDVDVAGSTVTNSENGFGLDLEGALVISPIAGFGFYIGPNIDLGLSGKVKQESGGNSVEADHKVTNFGLNGGLVGWF